ncbi:MAG: methenyltetrahydromethanopterin cyclohydrolase [Planctomycetota bacterium]
MHNSPANQLGLNARAALLCRNLEQESEGLGIARSNAGGAALWDFGVNAPGSVAAGVMLARVCLADLARVAADEATVSVETEDPVAACMASQYAGWEVKGEGYFAMGSGPMRAAAGREELFDHIGRREQAEHCVGVLESAKLPGSDVCTGIAEKCCVPPERLTLLVAPTSSPAGTVQIAARSVETALHKLHELGFDLERIQSGRGTAPMPPVAGDDLAAIGVTNDAILYGGQVTLTVRGDDASLKAIGPRVPSSASADYGRPFAEVLRAYDHDFYKIDPLLFSPAEIALHNAETGNAFRFGGVNREVLDASFDSVSGAS